MATNHTTGTVVKFKAAGQVSMDTVPLIAVIYKSLYRLP